MMFQEAATELVSVVNQLKTSHFDIQIQKTVQIVADTFLARKKMLLVGNGGSAAEAQHMAAEYTATLSCRNFRSGLPALALTTDTSFLTAWSNDFGLKDIFARQVETIGSNGDVLFAYSTSGNSENILRAVDVAQEKNIDVIGFSGCDGGKLFKKVDMCFIVPSNNTARIQECHTLIGHTICGQVEKALGYNF